MIDAKIIIFFEFRPHIQPSSQKFLPIASPLPSEMAYCGQLHASEGEAERSLEIAKAES